MEHQSNLKKPSLRAILAYYLGVWQIAIVLLIGAIDCAILAIYYQLHEDESHLAYVLLPFLFIFMIFLWYKIETEWYPHPPEGSLITRKEFLTQPGGYFDHPIRFLIGFGWGIGMWVGFLGLTVITIFTVLGI